MSWQIRLEANPIRPRMKRPRKSVGKLNATSRKPAMISRDALDSLFLKSRRCVEL